MYVTKSILLIISSLFALLNRIGSLVHFYEIIHFSIDIKNEYRLIVLTDNETPNIKE